jgi:flagellar biosynthesis/type III secretory pathway M-ring protein FliF/YscJ
MIAPAVFGYRENLGQWLVSTDHAQNQVINWSINALLTFVLLGLIIRPIVRKGRRSWLEHRATQRQIAASNERVADLLDTTTPGGLTDLVEAVREQPR